MNHRNGKLFILVFLLIALPGLCRLDGQRKSENDTDFYRNFSLHKYLQNYSAGTYGARNQNWSVLQDKRGILYFANQSVLLEFDGVAWQRLSIPNHTVRSMDIDENDTIYIGGVREIGYMKANKKGKLTYNSLLPKLEKKHQNFGNIYQTICVPGATWFRTGKKLFRWRKGKFKVWTLTGSGNSFRSIFLWRGECYIQKYNVGVLKAVGDTLELVAGTANPVFMKKRISMALPFPKGKLLLGTRLNALYLWDGSSLRSWPTEADAYLKKNRISYGLQLRNGDLAVATLNRGLVILSGNGRLKSIFNSETSGLPADSVKHILEDSGGSLWLALDNGISRIDFSTPQFFFDHNKGLKGLVTSVARHKNCLYAGTSNGLFFLAPPVPGKPNRFHPVPGTSGEYWDLLSVENSLLAASRTGVMEIDDNKTETVISNILPLSLKASTLTPGRVWVGTENSILAIKRLNTAGKSQESNTWHTEFQVKFKRWEVHSIQEESNGNLWLGTRAGALKIIPAAQDPVNAAQDTPKAISKLYGKKKGLPKGEVYVTNAAGHIVFATSRGTFQYDKRSDKFVADPTFGKTFSDGSRNVFRMTESAGGDIWFYSSLENFHAIKKENRYIVNPLVFPMIKSQVNGIYAIDGVIWFAFSGGLVGHDSRAGTLRSTPLTAMVREVKIPQMKSPVFSGSRSDNRNKVPPVLPYKHRNLKFQAAAPFYKGNRSVEYSFRMDGFDKKWSDWSTEPFKHFTNLDHGNYTFRVKAKDVYGRTSTEDTFLFELLPPWYFTWWAYCCYAAIAFYMVFLVVKWRNRKLVKEKEHLEQVVKTRTRQINEANDQLQQKTHLLEQQSEQLKELDKAKSRFFANISHEFRTPLSLIMGPLDQILVHQPGKEVSTQVDMAYRNAQRLLRLINQLLDLSKLESGKMRLEAEQRDLVAFIKALLEPFQLAAMRQQVELFFSSEKEELSLFFDVEKMEKIMINLLSNALKFTPANGTITIAVSLPRHADGEKFVDILVKDSGVGIPLDQLPHIFDRFFQAGTIEHRQKGSGIGLSLTRELVELHKGEITVTSHRPENGSGESGTRFIIRLPLGSRHLSPDQILSSNREPSQPVAGVAAVQAAHALAAPDDDESAPGAGEIIEAVENPEENITSKQKEMILVVEDNADLRYYIRTSLGPDFHVEEAENGSEGIRKAKEMIPDLIISDIMMPEADGYELCKAVKTDISTSHIPVILLTAKTSEASILQGLETGADDYITKPFNTRVLCARVRNLIELRRQLQNNLNREMVMQPSQLAVSRIDQEFLNDLQKVIETNLAESDLNVEELSRRLYMSRTTLYRKIQALSGETPTDFIRGYRLKRAAQLLKNQFGSVTEVAFEVGFSSRAYFTKCFKEKFHRLPSEYADSGPVTGKEVN